MNIYKILLILLGTLTLSIPTPHNSSLAKFKTGEKAAAIPTCTGDGTIQCPKGFTPTCPEQYKPSCVFLTNKQLPACLADNADGTFYSYRLDKVSCKKVK